MLLYVQLKQGQGDSGGLSFTTRTCSASIMSCKMDTVSWEETALDRNLWRQQVHHGVEQFESNRVATIQEKRERSVLHPAQLKNLFPKTYVENPVP